jgi:hypothetical protein
MFVEVPGAQPGDTVAVGFAPSGAPKDAETVVFSGQITAAGKATVIAFNTARLQAVVAGTIRVDVWRH